MKTIYNKYYVDYPLHLYAYEQNDENFEFTLYNEEEKAIETITFLFGTQEISVDIKSSEKVIQVKIQNDKIENTEIKPTLYSCKISGKEYLISNYKDFYTIKATESIYTLGGERYLYAQVLSKAVKKPKKQIQYIASQQENYWTCTCGNYNLNSFHECTNCGNKQSDVFSVEVPVDEANGTRLFNIKLFKGALAWMLIAYVLQFVYQSFAGDFLFTNLTKNNFFPVFNRLIMPTMLILILVGILLTTQFYQRILDLILKIALVVIVVYLNIISTISFILTAYNLLTLIAADLMILGMAYYQYRARRTQIASYVISGLIILSLGFMVFQWSQYSKYSLIIQNDGIRLNVETSATDYTIPETIDKAKVAEVYFNVNLDYQIKTLTVSKNVSQIFIYSTAVLPDLDTIKIQTGNPNFYVSGNILYNADGSMRLVPMATTTLTIDTETVVANQFRDLYNLQAITIGPNVKYIEEDAFANDISLKSIIFSGTSQLQTIGKNAFLNCESLEQVTLPISLQHMDLGVFEGCTDLTYLKTPFIGEEREVTEDLTKSSDVLVYQFGSRTWLDFDKIPNSLETVDIYDIDRIHNVTFYNAKHVRNIILPDTLLHLGKKSFYGTTELQTFTVPNGVTTIDESCFENSGIKSIVIPASVTVIGDNAFKNCNYLTSVTYLGNAANLTISSTGNQEFIDAFNGGN